MATAEAVDAARYVGAKLRELAALARGSGLDVLGHLIEVAALEAEITAMGPPSLFEARTPPRPSN